MLDATPEMRPLACLVSQMKTTDRCPQAESASHFNLHSILLILQLLRRLQVLKLPSFNLPCKANHSYNFQSFICFKFQVFSCVFVFIHEYIFQRVLQCLCRYLHRALTLFPLQLVNASKRLHDFKSLNYFRCALHCSSNHARIYSSHIISFRGPPKYVQYTTIGIWYIMWSKTSNRVKPTCWAHVFALNVEGRRQPLRLLKQRPRHKNSEPHKRAVRLK